MVLIDPVDVSASTVRLTDSTLQEPRRKRFPHSQRLAAQRYRIDHGVVGNWLDRAIGIRGPVSVSAFSET